MQVFLNAHKVFQFHTGNNKVSFLEFLLDAISLLVTAAPIFERPIHVVVTHLSGKHFPSIKKPEGAKDQRPTEACRVCSARGLCTEKGKYLKTVYICKNCPSEPGLHPDVF